MPKYKTNTDVLYTVEAEFDAPNVGDAIAQAYEWAANSHHLESPSYHVNVSGRTQDGFQFSNKPPFPQENPDKEQSVTPLHFGGDRDCPTCAIQR